MSAPTHLYQCATRALQKEWIVRALKAGQVLTDSGLWLGGVDRPEAVMAEIRGDGLAVVSTTKRVIDAADEEHDDLAWRLAGTTNQLAAT